MSKYSWLKNIFETTDQHKDAKKQNDCQTLKFLWAYAFFCVSENILFLCIDAFMR